MRKINRRWAGTLTSLNVEQVADVALNLLGRKIYKVVEFDGCQKSMCQGHDGENIKDHDISVLWKVCAQQAEIVLCGWVKTFAFTTQATSDRLESDLLNPFIVFDDDRMLIMQKIDGVERNWVFVVEHEG